MKTKHSFIILFLTFSFFVKGQETKVQWDVEELGDISVLLYRQVDSTKVKTGTGTIIFHDKRYFLLTASHVAMHMDVKSEIFFRVGIDKPLIKELKNLSLDTNVTWIYHPVADIAVLELKFPQDSILKGRYKELAFPISQIYGRKDLPSTDADIVYYGYPIIDLKLEHFSALSFSSHLSSGLITTIRGDTKTSCNFFYLDSPSIEGCSGSGVFYGVKKTMYIGSKTTVLIGLIHGTYCDNTGGKIAAVTPSFYIYDLFK